MIPPLPTEEDVNRALFWLAAEDRHLDDRETDEVASLITRLWEAHKRDRAELTALVNHDRAMIANGIMRPFMELERAEYWLSQQDKDADG